MSKQVRSKSPHEYKRRVLLAVAGLSPQVITETLDVLVSRSQPAPFVPTEIQVITTSLGADRIRETLIGQRWLKRLVSERGVPMPLFNNDTIHVMVDPNTQEELDDNRSVLENSATGDFIVNLVRRFTNDDTCAVHASLAGGRKTMGYYLGAAMSLYARPQDRLSHILVGEAYENPNFFYRTTDEAYRYFEDRSGHTRDAAEARLELAELNFMRLRNQVPRNYRNKDASLLDNLDALHERIDTATMIIDLPNQTVIAGTTEIPMPPRVLAFLLMLVVFVKEQGRALMYTYKNPDPEAPDYAEQLAYNREVGERMLDALGRVHGSTQDVANRTRQVYEQHGMEGTRFSELLLKTKERLDKADQAQYLYHPITKRVPGKSKNHLDLPLSLDNVEIIDH